MLNPINRKYTYLFITGRRVRERTVKAPDKRRAIGMIRDKYPEVLRAGVDWLCVEEGEDYRGARHALLAWNGLSR